MPEHCTTIKSYTIRKSELESDHPEFCYLPTELGPLLQSLRDKTQCLLTQKKADNLLANRDKLPGEINHLIQQTLTKVRTITGPNTWSKKAEIANTIREALLDCITTDLTIPE